MFDFQPMRATTMLRKNSMEGFELNEGEIELTITETNRVEKFTGDFYLYTIEGRDSVGGIACQRRYNHFFLFHQALIKRFPGLYIPPIPEKRGDQKTTEVTQERKYFLDQFLKECCSLIYLAQSGELQIFLRP